MKLRLQSNSIRLRLKRGEVTKLAKTGFLEESIILGSGADEIFHYILETSYEISEPRAELRNKEILVRVPVGMVIRWASGDEVGIEALQPVGGGGDLQVLIEKDFACLDRPGEENIDTFPNPLAGSKC